MDNNMFQRLKDLVTQHQQIGIIVPPNPTHDEMAAALGMYLTLKQMGKNVSVASPTDPTVAVSSLVGIDKVQKALSAGSGGDLVVTFPYKEGEIEKVSYTVDNGQLNIVVKAGPNGMSFNQSDVQFKQGGAGGAMPTLLFTMGVTDMNQVASVVNPAEMTNVTVVNMDNKQTNTGFGDVVHVSPRFSSISEMVADFLTLLEPQIELDVDTSQDLLSGILSATADFQNGRGSYLAFEMTGILMKKGAVRNVNGASANPTTPAMPATNYFPPASNAPQAVPQPVQQPQFQAPQPMMQQPAPAPMAQQPNQPMAGMPSLDQLNPAPIQSQPFDNAQSQGPVQQPQPVQSINEVQQSQPAQQPVQQSQNDQPPADWLTPKVYKGSTVL